MFEILVEVNEIIFAVKKIYHIFDEQHMKKKNEKIFITDYQPSNCAWWGFNTSDFLWAGGTRWVPWLLFRLRFRVSFGRSMGLPCWSTGWGHRDWCSIFQYFFVALGLQTYTIPVTSLVQDGQNVFGLLLQKEIMHCPWKGLVTPAILRIWFPTSSGKIGIESNSYVNNKHWHKHLVIPLKLTRAHFLSISCCRKFFETPALIAQRENYCIASVIWQRKPYLTSCEFTPRSAIFSLHTAYQSETFHTKRFIQFVIHNA